jgi:hypothetical protein
LSTLIYVETSIPSFYYDTRTARDLQARRDWTRQWWSAPKPDTILVVGAPVVIELKRAPIIKRKQALELIAALPSLDVSSEIDEIIEVYLEHKLMPRDAEGDAAHLALASLNKCDLLVTWNCKHLANANKFGHIHRVNALLGLSTPDLVTPLQLLETSR